MTRSGRESRPPSRYNEYVCLKTLVDEQENNDHDMNFALAASTDPDVLYYHQAIVAPDADHFILAMIK